MVKIYTRKGDDGTTSLWYGGRVAKDDLHTEAYGALDEATSALGVARATCGDEQLAGDILRLQNELFVAGAELDRIAVAGPAHAVDPDVGVRFYTLRPQIVTQGVADIRVFRRHDAGQRFEDRDPHAQPREHLRQLETHGARADHDE